MTHARESVLLIDDDPAFGAIATAVARARGFDASWYASLIDMGSFARIKSFDIAIIDYFLESFRGDEVAEYVDTFFSEIPVLIVSAHEMDPRQMERWPASIKGFVPKSKGAEAIVDEAQRILRRERLLKRWLTSSPSDPILARTVL